MKRMRTLGAMAIGVGFLAACSAASTENLGASTEKVGASSAAITDDTFSETISATDYANLATLTAFGDSTLSFKSGQATFTLSPALVAEAKAAAPDAGPDATGPFTFPVPTMNVPAPDPFGPYTVSVTALSMSNLSTDLQPTGMHVHADLAASLHLYSPNILQPTFDAVLTDVAADALISVAQPDLDGPPQPPVVATGSNGSLTASLAVAIPGSVTVQNCLFGACDSLVQDQLGNIAGQLQTGLQAQLKAVVENQTAPYTNTGPYASFLGVLAGYETFVQRESLPTLPKGGSWSILGTPAISVLPTLAPTPTAAILFTLISAPPAPTGCTEVDSCYGTAGQGTINVSCAPAEDPPVLQWLPPGTSTWESSAAGGLGAGTMTQYNVGVSEAFDFRVCTTNAVATTCSAPFSYTTPATFWCTAGNLGGGVFGGGAPVKPCGGHICDQ